MHALPETQIVKTGSYRSVENLVMQKNRSKCGSMEGTSNRAVVHFLPFNQESKAVSWIAKSSTEH